MNRSISGWRAVAVLCLLALSACVALSRPTPMESARYYQPERGDQLLHNFAPALWVEESHFEHNRPGAVLASSPADISIDPDTPAMYAEQRYFSTAKGDYTNLLYRVHFKEIPSGYAPYYLGAGKNVGLLVVVTLDAVGRPLLITTLHTCGCYLSFIPTSNLPSEARPTGWSSERQAIFGESLPASLDVAVVPPEQLQLQIRIRPDTHRVMDVWLAAAGAFSQQSVTISLHPLDNLKQLPLGNGQTTSFYETSGSRAGHVKGSFKPRERLFMSWWTLAWDVGQDKYLGKDRDDGPVFFTSLQPWARNASDMRDFVSFLHYWGWNL